MALRVQYTQFFEVETPLMPPNSSGRKTPWRRLHDWLWPPRIAFRPADEKRQWQRHATDILAFCSPASEAPQGRWAGRGIDISGGGLSLLLPKRCEPGMLLHVEMKRPKNGNACHRLMLVVHVLPESEDRWRHGGTFYTELAPDELSRLRA